MERDETRGGSYRTDEIRSGEEKTVVQSKPKKKGKWTCVVGPCDFIDEDANLKE